MQLNIVETTADMVRAGYSCPCGCRPSVTYARHARTAHDSCCCGNEFDLGPEGGSLLRADDSFRRETQSLRSPWGEPLEAVWRIGPSTHPAEDVRDHAAAAEGGHEAHHHAVPMAPAQRGAEAMDSAVDPVCGMTVDREAQRAKGLVSSYEGHDYFFCGKGCKLDFEEDPARYFDPTYRPTM